MGAAYRRNGTHFPCRVSCHISSFSAGYWPSSENKGPASFLSGFITKHSINTQRPWSHMHVKFHILFYSCTQISFHQKQRLRSENSFMPVFLLLVLPSLVQRPVYRVSGALSIEIGKTNLQHLVASPQSVDTSSIQSLVIQLNEFFPLQVLQSVCVLVQSQGS